MDNTNTNTNLTAIERALAAAKARKAAREALEADPNAAPPEAPIESVARMPIDPNAAALRAAEKAAAAAARETKRAEKRAAREAKRAETASGPSHMKKVMKAREKLPAMDEATARSFSDVIGSLTALQISTLSLHLQVHNREQATLRAGSQRPLSMGAKVRIVGGDPKFVGMVGTVVHAQKLRAKVAVDGFKNPVYIYTGEAEPVEEA